MKAKLFVGLLCSATLLSACDKEYTGATEVRQSFVAKQKPNSAAVVRIDAGTYSTKIKVSKSITTFTLTNPNLSTSFSANTPSRLLDGGIFQNFELSPAELGQSFGLKGQVNTRTFDSAPFGQTNSCVYDSFQRRVCRPGYWERGRRYCEAEERYCHRVPDRSRDGYRCEWRYRPGRCYNEADRWIPGECHYETEYVYGRQTTTGFNRTTETALNVRIESANSNYLGNLKIQDKSNTVYIEQNVGPCIR